MHAKSPLEMPGIVGFSAGTSTCWTSRAASNSTRSCWLCFQAASALCTGIAATANPLTILWDRDASSHPQEAIRVEERQRPSSLLCRPPAVVEAGISPAGIIAEVVAHGHFGRAWCALRAERTGGGNKRQTQTENRTRPYPCTPPAPAYSSVSTVISSSCPKC
jgi:hypothetical protein